MVTGGADLLGLLRREPDVEAPGLVAVDATDRPPAPYWLSHLR